MKRRFYNWEICTFFFAFPLPQENQALHDSNYKYLHSPQCLPQCPADRPAPSNCPTGLEIKIMSNMCQLFNQGRRIDNVLYESPSTNPTETSIARAGWPGQQRQSERIWMCQGNKLASHTSPKLPIRWSKNLKLCANFAAKLPRLLYFTSKATESIQ